MSTWHDVAADNLADGVHRAELPGGRGIALVRRGSRWWALRNACPHQGARLSEGAASGKVMPCMPGDTIVMVDDEPVLICPWHGWEFDAATGRCVTDSGQRVRAYEVKIDAGRVWVEMNQAR